MLSEMWRTPTSYHYYFMLKNVENFKPSAMKTYKKCTDHIYWHIFNFTQANET